MKRTPLAGRIEAALFVIPGVIGACWFLAHWRWWYP